MNDSYTEECEDDQFLTCDICAIQISSIEDFGDHVLSCKPQSITDKEKMLCEKIEEPPGSDFTVISFLELIPFDIYNGNLKNQLQRHISQLACDNPQVFYQLCFDLGRQPFFKSSEDTIIFDLPPVTRATLEMICLVYDFEPSVTYRTGSFEIRKIINMDYEIIGISFKKVQTSIHPEWMVDIEQVVAFLSSKRLTYISPSQPFQTFKSVLVHGPPCSGKSLLLREILNRMSLTPGGSAVEAMVIDVAGDTALDTFSGNPGGSSATDTHLSNIQVVSCPLTAIPQYTSNCDVSGAARRPCRVHQYLNSMIRHHRPRLILIDDLPVSVLDNAQSELLAFSCGTDSHTEPIRQLRRVLLEASRAGISVLASVTLESIHSLLGPLPLPATSDEPSLSPSQSSQLGFLTWLFPSAVSLRSVASLASLPHHPTITAVLVLSSTGELRFVPDTRRCISPIMSSVVSGHASPSSTSSTDGENHSCSVASSLSTGRPAVEPVMLTTSVGVVAGLERAGGSKSDETSSGLPQPVLSSLGDIEIISEGNREGVEVAGRKRRSAARRMRQREKRKVGRTGAGVDGQRALQAKSDVKSLDGIERRHCNVTGRVSVFDGGVKRKGYSQMDFYRPTGKRRKVGKDLNCSERTHENVTAVSRVVKTTKEESLQIRVHLR